MKAIIMAGGEGVRLRPLTCSVPKPMVPILNKPVMEHIINLLKKNGITDIGSTLYYLPDAITEYFNDGSNLGVNLKYYIEETPLGTGGSVASCKDFMDDTLVVISGDALTNADISDALAFHKSRGSKVTIILSKRKIPLEYGIVITGSDGRITRFLEKPSWSEVFSDYVNTGIYIIEPDIFKYYTESPCFDFSKDLFPLLLKMGIPMYGYITDRYWNDIGDLKTYSSSNFDLLDAVYKKTRLRGLFLGTGTNLGSSAKLIPPVYIGKNCSLGEGSVVGPYAIIGDNSIIGNYSKVSHSILWNDVHIYSKTECRSTLLADNVTLKSGARAFHNSALGSFSCVLPGATIKPDVKVWPYKTIGPDMSADHDVRQYSYENRASFGNSIISPPAEESIDTFFAMKIGMAFNGTIPVGSTVLVSCSENSTSENLKLSCEAGLNSSGFKVIDAGVIPSPISRYIAGFFKTDAGIHFDMGDTKSEIFITGYSGIPADNKFMKKLEQNINCTDIKFNNEASTQNTVRITNPENLYISAFERAVKDLSVNNPRKQKIILCSPSSKTAEITKKLLAKYCEVITIDYNNFKIHSGEILKKLISENMCSAGIFVSSNGDNMLIADSDGKVPENEEYLLLSATIASQFSDFNAFYAMPGLSDALYEAADRSGANNRKYVSNRSSFVEMLMKHKNSETLPLQYSLLFDGILSASIIMAYAVYRGKDLKALLKELPEHHFQKGIIHCSFENRGRVIKRLLNEDGYTAGTEYGGIHFLKGNAAAHIVPDNNHPYFVIYSDSSTLEAAEEISVFVTEKLRNLILEKS